MAAIDEPRFSTELHFNTDGRIKIYSLRQLREQGLEYCPGYGQYEGHVIYKEDKQVGGYCRRCGNEKQRLYQRKKRG